MPHETSKADVAQFKWYGTGQYWYGTLKPANIQDTLGSSVFDPPTHHATSTYTLNVNRILEHYIKFYYSKVPSQYHSPNVHTLDNQLTKLLPKLFLNNEILNCSDNSYCHVQEHHSIVKDSVHLNCTRFWSIFVGL